MLAGLVRDRVKSSPHPMSLSMIRRAFAHVQFNYLENVLHELTEKGIVGIEVRRNMNRKQRRYL